MLPSQVKEETLFPMLKFRTGMDRLFEDFFGGEALLAPYSENGKMLPAIEIKETETALLVDAELPGLKPEEIQVTVEDGILTIFAERKQEKEEKGKNVRRTERYYGTMERKLALPSSVAEDKVDALYKDGVLHVTLPKKVSAKPQAVAVKVK